MNSFTHLCRILIRDNVIRFFDCEYQNKDTWKNDNNG